MASVVNDNGMLVEPEDEGGFARALERVLVDHGIGNSLGRNAIDRTRSAFSLGRLVSDIDALYRRLLTEGSQSRAPLSPVEAARETSDALKGP
jgi:glycosyltransferase involved in cell wall biosynthesis